MRRRTFVWMAAAVAASGCIHGDGEREEADDEADDSHGETGDGSADEEADEQEKQEEHTGFVPEGEPELETPRSIELENDLDEAITIDVDLRYVDDDSVEHEVFYGTRTVEGMGYEYFGAVVEHHGTYVVEASYEDDDAVESWDVDDDAVNALVVVEPNGELWISS